MLFSVLRGQRRVYLFVLKMLKDSIVFTKPEEVEFGPLRLEPQFFTVAAHPAPMWTEKLTLWCRIVLIVIRGQSSKVRPLTTISELVSCR